MIVPPSSAVLPTCIVLAGGLGTRLRSVVTDRPKCLAPVGSRTFLELQLELLGRRGISRFLLSLGHMAQLVIDSVEALRERFEIDWVVEPQPLGTGGGLLFTMNAKGLEEALVCNGDTWFDGDLSCLLTPLDLRSGEVVRMATVRVEDRSRFGGPALDELGWVSGFTDKGSAGPGPINAGFYRMHISAFGGFEPGSAFSLESAVIPKLVAARALRTAPVIGQFIDIGVPEDYDRFRQANA